MSSDPADKQADRPDTLKFEPSFQPHRLSYSRQPPSSEKSQRRHTVGRISFYDHTSVTSKSAIRLRPKSLECIRQTSNTRDRRPSFYLARTPATTDEFVVLDPPGAVTDEATLFPLQDDPTEQAITIRSCLTGILMGIIGSAVGLVSWIFIKKIQVLRLISSLACFVLAFHLQTSHGLPCTRFPSGLPSRIHLFYLESSMITDEWWLPRSCACFSVVF